MITSRRYAQLKKVLTSPFHKFAFRAREISTRTSARGGRARHHKDTRCPLRYVATTSGFLAVNSSGSRAYRSWSKTTISAL